ncbi:MAG: signal peptidase I [Verrucomicrobia subdivision 3 bacterium]|nr:signal peptidase I [Limisphaerales bacterium]
MVKLLAAQNDLLKPSRVDELQVAIDALKSKLTGPIDKAALQDEMDAMMVVADRVLIPFPDSTARDWSEMCLVVMVLVLAFRTFFFQPFKIPTGSMQPTLYGITIENLKDRTSTGKVEQGVLTANVPTFEPQDLGRTVTFANDKQAVITQFTDNQRVSLSPTDAIDEQEFTISFKLPSAPDKVADKLRGFTYHSLKAEGHWKLTQINPPKTVFPFIRKQNLVFKDLDTGKTVKKTVWFPPFDSHQQPIIGGVSANHGQPRIGSEFLKGEFAYKLRVKTGDHLFVNRVTFNFRRPQRGDICVFTTKNVPVPRDPNGRPLFYIKRLVALGNETVSIGRDRHIRINGRRLDANDSGFEFLYDFPVDYASIHRDHIRINGRRIDTGHSSFQNFLNTEPEIDFQSATGQIIPIPRYFAVNSANSGHINNSHPTASQAPPTAPKFQHSGISMKMLPDHYLMFGDNTTNSADSRDWGQLPMKDVIGKSSFVYWPPLSPRFGWSHR